MCIINLNNDDDPPSVRFPLHHSHPRQRMLLFLRAPDRLNETWDYSGLVRIVRALISANYGGKRQLGRQRTPNVIMCSARTPIFVSQNQTGLNIYYYGCFEARLNMRCGVAVAS